MAAPLATIALDAATWDFVLGPDGNPLVLTGAAALAQDAASAIRTFLGEYYFDTTVGVPYLTQIFGQNPSLALLKQQLVDAALTVPGVAAAQVFISSFANRSISGQVQVVASGTAQTAAANFTVSSPQGTG